MDYRLGYEKWSRGSGLAVFRTQLELAMAATVTPNPTSTTSTDINYSLMIMLKAWIQKYASGSHESFALHSHLVLGVMGGELVSMTFRQIAYLSSDLGNGLETQCSTTSRLVKALKTIFRASIGSYFQDPVIESHRWRCIICSR